MLLAKTLRSSTFKLALIWIGIFGALVLALLSYVYWSTAAYVREKTDRAIAAEETSLRNVYDKRGTRRSDRRDQGSRRPRTFRKRRLPARRSFLYSRGG